MSGDLQKAKNAAFRYLSARARSVGEVCVRLREQGFSPAIVAAVVADLQRRALLDDREFARRWVEARLQRASSEGKLAQDLQRKGVPAAVVEEVLSEYAPLLHSAERASALLGKQAWRYRGLVPSTAKRRMLAFLARRGFAAETAQPVVEQVWQELVNEVDGN